MSYRGGYNGRVIEHQPVDAEESRRNDGAFPGRSQVTTLAGARGLAFALLLAAYFLYFAWDGMSAPIAVDTFANIYGYWKQGAPWLLGAQLQLWGGNYRPLGGLFYLALFHFFDLNPLPYHLVMALIVLANAYWVYVFARILGCTELVSAMAG